MSKKYYRIQASELVYYEFYVEASNKREATLAVEEFDGGELGIDSYIVDGDYFEITEVIEEKDVLSWIDKKSLVKGE
jgi:hypothetical protein